MAITEEMYRLANSARRLNAGSDQLNRLIERIDDLLSRLMIGLDYVHPRPIDETTTADTNGKRVIELSYVGYLRTQRGYHLSIKTVKVLESKLQLATQNPGDIQPLLSAPRRLRYAAVDVLPEVISGLANQVDEMVGSLERRCNTAEALVYNLEQVAAVGGTTTADDSRTGGTLVPEERGPRKVIAPGEAPGQAIAQPVAPPMAQPAAGHPSESGAWVVPSHPPVPNTGSHPVVPPQQGYPQGQVQAQPGEAHPRSGRTVSMGSTDPHDRGGG